MKKQISWFKICAISLMITLLPGVLGARSLDTEDLKKIQCAQDKMRILAGFFNVDSKEDEKTYTLTDLCGVSAKKPVTMPDWFVEELPRMDSHKILYVKAEDYTYSEVDLWRQAFSNVYLYLDRAAQSLDPNKPIVLEQLSRGYVGNRLNLMATLDRLNKDLLRSNKFYTMKDSMQGRARSMLSTLELINNEFFSTIESFSSPISQRDEKYRKSVMAVVVLANHLYAQFMGSAIPTADPPKPETYRTTRADRVNSLLLILVGSLLAGMFVYFLINNKRDSITAMMEDYREKSAIWAEDFNRQFVTIDVKYIVMGVIIIFLVIGFLFGWMIGGFLGVFVFLGILAFGAMISVRVPASILETLKRSRGVKVNKQLMDALILLSNSLRSGMDIVQGFEMVSKDLLPPISDEFGLVVKNYRLGMPFEQALDGMVSRVDSRMLAYIVKAIIIQRQVGGNLPVIFARLVENIREESKLEEKLQAMTAQQRIQSIVVSVMPFIMMAVMFVFNPTQMISFYTSPVGMVIFLFCVVWIFIGMQVLKKLGDIRV
ncbi:MAG: type II secretion system F family protein [Elusimicrobiaceae bacterium]|nr:type II secretion system F family protein [Elusimicrobiaceae bacterium]